MPFLGIVFQVSPADAENGALVACPWPKRHTKQIQKAEERITGKRKRSKGPREKEERKKKGRTSSLLCS